ncbi:MAG TPA: hypothetical protein PL041_10595 [Melioribacteraceae bacterium]|nr:hypothetical protein [Melioribacteraceae bacterium]
MSNKSEVKESFMQKLARLWPVYLMESIVYLIVIAIIYLLIFA